MDDQHYGGFWRRMAAFMIDKTIIYAFSFNVSLIVFLAVGLGGDIISLLRSPAEEATARIGSLTSLCVFLSVIIDMIYFTWFIGVSGQTPGKMLLRLRVVAASGEPVTTGTAFLRWTGTIISGLFFFLGFFWIAIDPKKQGWHDKIAMTFVVPVSRVSDSPASGNAAENNSSPAMTDVPDIASSPSALLVPPQPIPDNPPSYDGQMGQTNGYPQITEVYKDHESRDEKGLDKQNEIL